LPYGIQFDKQVEKVLNRIAKKDKAHYAEISKKLEHIVEDPHRFKPLRAPLNGYHSVHVRCFVIIYHIDEQSKTIHVDEYKHHDEAYEF
jgi:YafQ family addiction module toxin component